MSVLNVLVPIEPNTPERNPFANPISDKCLDYCIEIAKLAREEIETI